MFPLPDRFSRYLFVYRLSMPEVGNESQVFVNQALNRISCTAGLSLINNKTGFYALINNGLLKQFNSTCGVLRITADYFPGVIWLMDAKTQHYYPWIRTCKLNYYEQIIIQVTQIARHKLKATYITSEMETNDLFMSSVIHFIVCEQISYSLCNMPLFDIIYMYV